MISHELIKVLRAVERGSLEKKGKKARAGFVDARERGLVSSQHHCWTKLGLLVRDSAENGGVVALRKPVLPNLCLGGMSFKGPLLSVGK